METQPNCENTAEEPVEGPFAEQVMTCLTELKSGMLSLANRLERVESGERSFQTRSSTPGTARSAPHSSPPANVEFAHSLSWADRMEEQDEMVESMEQGLDEDGEGEHDARGIKLFATSDRTESFLRPPFSVPLANATRRQLKERYGMPSLPFTSSPHLDKVLKSRVSSTVKSHDKEIAKIQALALDAVGPLTRIVEDACDGSLSAKDNLDAAQTALRLLGNCAAHCNRARRTAILQALNPRIVDMAEEDALYRDAGLSLFGEGFCRKAKERDDEMKALNSFSATGGQPRRTEKASTSSVSPFFPGHEGRRGKHRPFSNYRGRPRFGPYQSTGAKRGGSHPAK